MVYVDDNTKERIQKINLNSVYFLVNFDNIITDSTSYDTWDFIKNNIRLNKTYLKKFENLMFRTRSIELENDLDLEHKSALIKETYRQKLDFINSLDVDEKKIKRYINNEKYLRIRDGVRDFLKMTCEKNIPVIIVSDGISEVIKDLLNLNKCYFDNIYILANSLVYNVETEMNQIVHLLNKNELTLCEYMKEKLCSKSHCILLTNNINDINMICKEKLSDSIKIAFLDKNINENFDMFLNYFNIICTHDSSLRIIANMLKAV